MKRFLFTIAIFLCINNLYGQAVNLPSGNLDAWYPFCGSGDLLDRTFGGFDLIGANLTPAPDRFGRPNRAYSFNGVNSEMHYSTTFALPIFGVAEFTYSCHVYPTAIQDAIILYNGNPTVDGFGIVMNDGTFGGGPGNNVSLLFNGTDQQLPTPITINQWHHLLLRRVGNGYIFFVDGVNVGSYIPATTPGFAPPTTVFQLGYDFTANARAYTGRIDDVAIYSRQVNNPEVLRLRDFNPNIDFTLGVDTAICENVFYLGGGSSGLDTNVYPNKQYFPNGYKYTWSTGDTTRSFISINFPIGLPSPIATRSLTIERLYSCPTNRLVNIRHIIPQVDLGNDTIFCSGDSLELNSFPNSVSQYLWNTGDTTPTIKVWSTGIYYVTVDSLSGRCIAFDTVDVLVVPPTSVRLRSDTLLCQGGTVTLFSLDTPYTAPVYTWSDGITTTPTFTVTASGTYWLEVLDNSCRDADTVNVTIVYDTVTVLSNDTAICKGASVTAISSYDPTITYQWTPTTGMPISTIPTPLITPDTSAWYVVNATILSCVARDSFYIDVQPNPIVKLGGNRNVCEFDSIRITPIVTPGWYTNYTFDWTPGTFLDDSTAPTVIFTAGDTTKLILTVSTPAGCSISDSIIINKYNGNFASMRTDTVLCPSDSVQLFPFSTEPGMTYYSWNPPTYIDNPNSATPVIKPITNINYDIIATSMYGCKDTLSYAIVVNPAAVITITDSVVLFPGETYQISPISNCTRFSWAPPIGLSDTSASNPIANPPVSTKYTVTARTENGCIAVDSISIRVNENSIISVPNAFAPSSAVNGKLRVILNGIARLRYFRIYNRWGNIVYEGENISDGWDGTLGGTPQPLGVYVYEAEAVTDQGKILRKQGNVTLLR